MRLAAFLFAGLLLAPTAQAADCLDMGDLAAAPVPLQLTAPKQNFIGGSETGAGCPNDMSGCQRKAYLIKGDTVLRLSEAAPYSCVLYPASKQPIYGWLPTAQLAPAPNAPAGNWPGKWVADREHEIRIAKLPAGRLKIDGDATWGAGDPERVKRGGVNIGNLGGQATPQGNLIAGNFPSDSSQPVAPYASGDQFDCRARLRLVGDVLLVSDNGNCGGHNVTFTGVYRRH